MAEAPDMREDEDCPGAEFCGRSCDQHPAPTYRPGDIAMVRFDEVDDPYTCVLIGGHRWQSIAMTGLWTTIPLTVGPVLGNVADIAAAETERIEAVKHDEDCCQDCGSDHYFLSFSDPDASRVMPCTGCTCKEAP